jgi:uncharacterized membrane protein YhfC
MVGGASIAAMAFSLLASLGVPGVFLWYFITRGKIDFLLVRVGMLTFVVASQLLEKLLHLYFLQWNARTVALLADPWAYAVYGGLAAGIFEECGRYVAFRFILKKFREWRDGIGYGIGHGGIEAIVLGALASLPTLITALQIDFGGGDGSPMETALMAAPAYAFAVAGVERAMAFLFQLGLSLIVLYAAREGKIRFLFLAILLHAVVDFPAGLSQKGIIGLWSVEAFILGVGVASAVFVAVSKRIFDKPAALVAPA